MTEHYTEPISASEHMRKLYADSVSNAVALLRLAAGMRREKLVTPELMAKRRDEYREEFAKLLGIDTCRAVFGSGIPKAELTPAGEDELCTIQRIKFKLCDGVYFTGLLLIPHQRKARAPLAVMTHGGGGSPELCCDMVGNNNYGGVARRMLNRGVIVFAPQLLLWNVNPAEEGSPIPQFGTPYNRFRTDTELRQCGVSIAGFEIYEISRALDFLLHESYIDAEACGMAGLSYGGFYTLYTMAYDTRIKSGWSAAFFSDRTKFMQADFIFMDSAGRFLDPETAGLCAPRRLWIDFGKHDTVFSTEGIEELFARAHDFYNATTNVTGIPSQLRTNFWDGGHKFSDNDEALDYFLEGIGAVV